MILPVFDDGSLGRPLIEALDGEGAAVVEEAARSLLGRLPPPPPRGPHLRLVA